MQWIEDGKSVILSALEYGQLCNRIQSVEKNGREAVIEAQQKQQNAEKMLDELLNKDGLVRQMDDMVNSRNALAESCRKIVSEAETLMQEVYYHLGNVSRTERTEIVALMNDLRKGAGR